VRAGLDPERIILRPLHQPGTDGERSWRWWIHQQDTEAQALIKEREDLQNELGKLKRKQNSFFTNDEERAEIAAQMDAALERIQAIEALLAERSFALEQRLASQLEPLRYPRGEQLRKAVLRENRIILEVSTLEPLPPTQWRN
jgi:hypothetical protein